MWQREAGADIRRMQVARVAGEVASELFPLQATFHA